MNEKAAFQGESPLTAGVRLVTADTPAFTEADAHRYTVLRRSMTAQPVELAIVIASASDA
jgi:hypothetical protein